MVKGKERKSRVKGSTIFIERKWGSGKGKNFKPYRIPQVEWANRVNYLRGKMGGAKLSEALGISTTDPSYKTLRRWTTGERVPEKREYYDKVNTLYNRYRTKDLTPIRKAINDTKIVKKTKGNFTSKLNLFELSLRGYSNVMSGNNSPGINGEYGEYIQTVDNDRKTKAPGRRAVVFINTYVKDSRKHTEQMEAILINREDSPSLELLQNAIETKIQKFPTANDYLIIAVTGIWFSYV